MRKALFLLLVVLAACTDSTGIDDRWADPETIDYAASLNVDLASMQETASGLYWKDTIVGDGEPVQVGEWVRIHYTGWLPDGTQFDTSRERGPVEFQLGLGFVMTGVDEGVIGMRIGGVRQLVIRPGLTGFGPGGRPASIPPNTTLIVEVERLTTPAH
jgi:peptidylprolyl isomerase